MCLSELLIPCLIGHKIQALWFSMCAGQNNQKSSKMKRVARDFQLWLNSTKNWCSHGFYGIRHIPHDQNIVRKCFDWAKGLADVQETPWFQLLEELLYFTPLTVGHSACGAEPTRRQMPVPELWEPVLAPPVGGGPLGEQVRCCPAKTLCSTTSSCLNKLKCCLEKIHWQGFG